ncbi:hypothetical protein [Microbacterium sp. NPDC064584]|uniref:hypothetical protein n=1 Tax=Microbacterium sp. NPDC064584 TaxID=3155817 RepID=UPI003428B1F1
MPEHQPGALTALERAELEALRARAYGPDADIFDDAEAVSRLDELEERARAERGARLPAPEITPALTESGAPDDEQEAAEPAAERRMPTPIAPLRASRRHVAAIAATAVVALLLGGTAWSISRSGDPQRPSAQARAAAIAAEQRAAGYDAQYAAYFAGLREDILALPGAEAVADQLIWEQLTPYGILYGRTVGAGPTTDQRFCMIIADLPSAQIVCIPIEKASAVQATVSLPAWYSEADGDLFTGLGEQIDYTLLPGGVVVAVPAGASLPADDIPVVENPGPTPTATPPPGYN